MKRKLALDFVRQFCAGDIDGLSSTLSEDCRFSGPFHEFASKDAYIDYLRKDPVEKCGYTVLSVSENDDSVSIFYDYKKPKRVLTIAQLFKFKGQKISEILLVFDGRAFTRDREGRWNS